MVNENRIRRRKEGDRAGDSIAGMHMGRQAWEEVGGG